MRHDLTVETFPQVSGTHSPGFALIQGVLGGTRDLVIDLQRGQPLVGRLIDDAGDPVKGQGWIQVCRVGAAPGSPECVSARLLEAGGFESSALDTSFAYVIRAGGFQGYARGELTDVRPGDRDVVLRLEKGVPFSGRLLDAKGDAVMDVWVAASAIGRTVIIEGGAARTGAGGTFELAGAPRGTIRVSATIRGTHVNLGEFSAPGTDVVLRLPRE